MTPFEAAAVVKIGGLTITQMNAAMAKQSYPKYLQAPFNNAVVGVVAAVDAMSCRVAHPEDFTRCVADARQRRGD